MRRVSRGNAHRAGGAMTSPAKRSFGRSLKDFGKLGPAERKLLKACRTGEFATIGKALPEQKTAANAVRASFLRFLALGGDDSAPVHEHGAQLTGAFIEGTLDLSSANVPSNIVCQSCCFDSTLVLRDARFGGGLFLNGSQVPGIVGDRIQTAGPVFLRDGFQSTGAVRLLGAQIGGDLDCTKAAFDGKEGDALSADRAVIEGAFFFQHLNRPVNSVSLASAKVKVLVDDEKAWGMALVLDGFQYGAFGGDAPTRADFRIKWLNSQRADHAGADDNGKSFCPQPWHHLQKVLREMGHIESARQVGIAFEEKLRDSGLVGDSPENWPAVLRHMFRWVARFMHWCYGWLTGYGYRPMQLLLKFLFAWFGCAFTYWYFATNYAVFAPSDHRVYSDAHYAVCMPGSDEAKAELVKPNDAVPPPVRGAGNWTECEKLSVAYPAFSPLVYSLDVILPVVDMQQRKNWRPVIPRNESDPADSYPGRLTQIVIWFETLFGWVIASLLVAIVSGLAKRRED